jgi:hypothetical protein
MRGKHLFTNLILALGGLTLFGSGCFGTTTAQGLAQTAVQTVIQTLISLFVQQAVFSAST